MADEEIAPEEFEGDVDGGEAAAAEVDEVRLSRGLTCDPPRLPPLPHNLKALSFHQYHPIIVTQRALLWYRSLRQ